MKSSDTICDLILQYSASLNTEQSEEELNIILQDIKDLIAKDKSLVLKKDDTQGGFTPLEFAVLDEAPKICKLLLENGADPLAPAHKPKDHLKSIMDIVADGLFKSDNGREVLDVFHDHLRKNEALNEELVDLIQLCKNMLKIKHDILAKCEAHPYEDGQDKEFYDSLEADIEKLSNDYSECSETFGSSFFEKHVSNLAFVFAYNFTPELLELIDQVKILAPKVKMPSFAVPLLTMPASELQKPNAGCDRYTLERASFFPSAWGKNNLITSLSLIQTHEYYTDRPVVLTRFLDKYERWIKPHFADEPGAAYLCDFKQPLIHAIQKYYKIPTIDRDDAIATLSMHDFTVLLKERASSYSPEERKDIYLNYMKHHYRAGNNQNIFELHDNYIAAYGSDPEIRAIYKKTKRWNLLKKSSVAFGNYQRSPSDPSDILQALLSAGISFVLHILANDMIPIPGGWLSACIIFRTTFAYLAAAMFVFFDYFSISPIWKNNANKPHNRDISGTALHITLGYLAFSSLLDTCFLSFFFLRGVFLGGEIEMSPIENRIISIGKFHHLHISPIAQAITLTLTPLYLFKKYLRDDYDDIEASLWEALDTAERPIPDASAATYGDAPATTVSSAVGHSAIGGGPSLAAPDL